ncbi:hypothetical protein [Streptomyces lasiicapitis]|uniref:hypothetical protein n=1 Tax=Streptomyces lasiicapitis TaxID=1923961 RepID=UPI003647CCCD
MLLLAALTLVGLAPGLITAWQVYQEHGWRRAVLAGAAVTVGLPAVLILSLIMFPPLAAAAAACSAILALKAYGDDQIWVGSTWTCVLMVALWCTGWTT